MINKNDFTGKAFSAIEHAVRIAGELGHTFAGTEHMVYGLVCESSGIAAAILENHGITEQLILEYLRRKIGSGIPYALSEDDTTPHLDDILLTAAENSRKSGAALTGTEYILSAILEYRTSGGYALISSICGDTETIKSECRRVFTGAPVCSYTRPDEKMYPVLSRYSKNFTETAWKNGFDPVIGRENETERIIQILARKHKNNPCLIGEAGVGKTAIVEGLAQLIVKRKVPDILKNKHILALDIPSMIAGAKYRGDFEERIKSCIEEAVSSRDIILFIDELHTIVGAGAAEGAIDAANILKPELARGDIQIIGATTYDEYRKFIESDSALERRFQPVTVNEPKREELFRILNGIRSGYEKFHSVNIPDQILRQAVYLSEKYIPERFLPDKAIDIIDEACSRAVLKHSGNRKNDTVSEITAMLRKNIESSGNVNSAESKHYDTVVTEDDVAEVVSLWTGIPVKNIDTEENEKLASIESELKKCIIGQDHAVKKISEAIRRCRVGLREENKPSASFLFAGPTGVGKTELAKAVARIIFGSEKNMIRLDMSEYMEKNSVSRLTGSPPGYVGYGESGTLSDMVRKKPYSVVLFDEIEKAHSDVLNLLLQITDEGVFRDSQGRLTSMKNTLIILTTNSGAEKLTDRNGIGFSGETQKSGSFISRMNESLTQMFRPELLNRMDGLIIFEPLTCESLIKISDLLLHELALRAEKIGIHLTYSRQVTEYIANDKDTKKYGARPLKRIIADKIENSITESIISGKIVSGDNIQITADNGNIILEQKNCCSAGHQPDSARCNS